MWTEIGGVKKNLYFSTMFSVPTNAILVRSDKPKFVEGSVSQLARVLYAIHEEHGAQPESAILEAIKTFGDDVDRNKAARSSAEALARKQKTLQGSGKFKTTYDIFHVYLYVTPTVGVRSLGKIGC